MDFDSYYNDQVEVLLNVLPIVDDLGCFALKGGTAINLFIRNMPRLSVDIDLTYMPIEPREDFLFNINIALENLAETIEKNADKQVDKIISRSSEQISKLIVRSNGMAVKIEPNFIFRGSVFDCVKMSLCEQAQKGFLVDIKTTLMSQADIYAGKICAALNRQHPRDLFDIKLLFDEEGISDKIRKAFVVHLACDSRPMSELLSPNLLDVSHVYRNEFQGMTTQKISLEELLEIRRKLIVGINAKLTDDERCFLLSIKQGEPDWSLIDLDVQNLPALKWKLKNVSKMDKKKHEKALEKLKRVLGL